MEHPSKKRRYPRVGLQRGIYMAWQGIGGRVVSQIKTVGLGGLFIEVTDPPPVGSVIRLYFEVPGGEIRARAIVKSSLHGEGMGIQFTSMEPEARARLTQLLRSLLKEADPAEAPLSIQP
jgi:PilZ domain